MNPSNILVRPIHSLEEQRFQQLMQAHHYLGALPKISETLRYVATFGDQWVALVSFSAAALKCSARDQWIGWDFRHQYDRLKLVTNNSRFLILPDLFKETPDPQLPGYLGVGQRPWTKGPAAFRLPIPKQALHPTEPGH